MTVWNIVRNDRESVYSIILTQEKRPCQAKSVAINKIHRGTSLPCLGTLCPESQLFPNSHFLEIGLINSTRGRHSVHAGNFNVVKLQIRNPNQFWWRTNHLAWYRKKPHLCIRDLGIFCIFLTSSAQVGGVAAFVIVIIIICYCGVILCILNLTSTNLVLMLLWCTSCINLLFWCCEPQF